MMCCAVCGEPVQGIYDLLAHQVTHDQQYANARAVIEQTPEPEGLQ